MRPDDHDCEGAAIDLGLYRQVIGRHRALVIVGALTSVLLALLAFVRVSPSGIGYRETELWSSQATLALSQDGFPEGRSVLPDSSRPSPSGYFATPDRFTSLVGYYAALATGDEVAEILRRRGLIKSDSIAKGALPISATALSPTVTSPTPLLALTANAPTPAAARQLVTGATRAFVDVVRTHQNASRIPESDRIVIRVVKRYAQPTLVAPRSKTTSIIVLLAGLTATFAAAFVRDNVRNVAPSAGAEGTRVTPVPGVAEGAPLTAQLAEENADPAVRRPTTRTLRLDRGDSKPNPPRAAAPPRSADSSG